MEAERARGLDHQVPLLVARQRAFVARREFHASLAGYASSLRSIELREDLSIEATHETEGAMGDVLGPLHSSSLHDNLIDPRRPKCASRNFPSSYDFMPDPNVALSFT